MTSIVLNDTNKALRLTDLFSHPPDELVQFVDSKGQLVGTLLFHSSTSRATEYADLIAAAEADMKDLELLARTPREQCSTTAEVLRRAESQAAE